ncbi:MAG: polyphosphate:AMP phosphotransferase [Clostridiales bacterium]|jgi:polyphosphate:AMP phosphotransferase|nr:polyphosphate:AMP phosphotransferase [Clostridiales bacterium]
MLSQTDLHAEMSKQDYKLLCHPLKERLSALQHTVKEQKLPVVALFEGWSAAGKGSLLSDVILTLDPRGFHVYSTVSATPEEVRKPLFWRYWTKMPARGQIALFDRSWYQELYIAQVEQGISDRERERRTESIRTMERQLTDEGAVIVKFFLHISQKEQRQRFEALADSKNTSRRVTDRDWKRNKQYDLYYQAADGMLRDTDSHRAPWHVIPSHDKRYALYQIYSILVSSIEEALRKKEQRQKALPQLERLSQEPIAPRPFPLVPTPKLREVSLEPRLSKEDYQDALEKAQKKLYKLHNRLYREKIPVIVAYEGWDAAGKGGNIKRVAAALDPRGYEVVPIAAPTQTELAHHYLWRFWNNLPKTGHIAIFDRTWYGRVMVERIEGFCSQESWQRAFQEIIEFERELYDWGAVIVKFWLHIDKDEQLRRFNDRMNTPEKRWKITDEDWRNREKWDQYEQAVDEMLARTSTSFAPWHIIQSQDKKFARIQTLNLLIKAIEEKLDA